MLTTIEEFNLLNLNPSINGYYCGCRERGEKNISNEIYLFLKNDEQMKKMSYKNFICKVCQRDMVNYKNELLAISKFKENIEQGKTITDLDTPASLAKVYVEQQMNVMILQYVRSSKGDENICTLSCQFVGMDNKYIQIPIKDFIDWYQTNKNNLTI